MKKIISKSNLFIFILIAINYSCIERVDKTENFTTHKLLDNKKHLELKVTKNSTTVVKAFKYDYERNDYNFVLAIEPENISWEGGAREPQSIIFCKDSIYISFLDSYKPDAGVNDSTAFLNKKIGYELFIDERYLFNLLGKSYWAEIPQETFYAKKKECKEYSGIGINNKMEPGQSFDSLFVK